MEIFIFTRLIYKKEILRARTSLNLCLAVCPCGLTKHVISRI